jgi:DNA modification methylase
LLASLKKFAFSLILTLKLETSIETICLYQVGAKFSSKIPLDGRRSSSAAIVNGTAFSLPIKNEEIALSVTSPPYHNAIDYQKHLENSGWYRGNLGTSLEKYLSEMKQAFAEVYRATRDGGFCCIIIGNELNNGSIIPLPHLLTNILCTGDTWIFHEEIIWNKVTGGLDRFGVTIQRPFPTYYRANIMHEQILVLRKGELKHTKDSGSKFEIDEVMKKDISNSIWNIAPVPPRYIDHPCPFPEEIPLRLVMLYSNKGDTILDPFAGSGQTGKAAKYLGRNFVGLDLQRRYCLLAKKRIENEEIHVRSALIAKWQKIGTP